MGVTGNLRTTRSQSSTAGSRTIGSILASGGSGSGAGSFVRIYNFYASRGLRQQFYNEVVFGLKK
jgi:hypothetical protein